MRPVSNSILLCMIEPRSSNTCVPQVSWRVGVSRVSTDVLADVAISESFYPHYLPFQRSDQDGDHCAIQAICLYRTRRSPEVEVPER